MTDYKPKLIEVALPLAEINAAASKEKSIRHGHPTMLHRWWARRPLAAARAVIWASLVDDPSCDASLTEDQQDKERERLFEILRNLVKWENSNNDTVLSKARREIERCFPDGPPPVLDPFGGGGTIPLEAQRLGLAALGGDLNPVAVLIQRAMLEIPQRFAALPPVHPSCHDALSTWERAQGLAADVEAYGRWMLDEAHARIGHLYPEAKGPKGESLTPIAWLWARTIESPDPTWHGHVPLVPSWLLENRPGKPATWIEPTVDRPKRAVTYRVRTGGHPTEGPTVNRGTGTCIATKSTILSQDIKAAGQANELGAHLLALVVDGHRGRIYVTGDSLHEAAAFGCEPPKALPAGTMSSHPQYMGTPRYGLDEWWKLFTPRQLTALTTFSELLTSVWEQVRSDAAGHGSDHDTARFRDGGAGPVAYADAIVTYLAFALDRCADYWSSTAVWHTRKATLRNTFSLQAIPMSWTFAEANPFSGSTGSFRGLLDGVVKALANLPVGAEASVTQRDASAYLREAPHSVISTDPPYYDNVPFSDISDFFFVWLRQNLADVWPDECSTLLTPKAEELVADSHRHGSREQAQDHFEDGMARFMKELCRKQVPGVPATIFYAYRTREAGGTTGWSTFLDAILKADLQITATWPFRTEMANRMRARQSNALASSIVLACRPRSESAKPSSRGDFIATLRRELPEAVRVLQTGGIAPVDLAQSSIGPGMKVYSQFTRVVEADGSDMTVSEALSIINDALGEVLDGEGAELDRDTRFAVRWYEQHGFSQGPSGDADSQARAKDTSLQGLLDSGIAASRGGKFWLRERHDLDAHWDPRSDDRLTAWEVLQHLIAALEVSESQAEVLLHRLEGLAEDVRQLAYILFRKATDNGWTEEAVAYNGFIAAWPDLQARDPEDDSQGSLLVTDVDPSE